MTEAIITEEHAGMTIEIYHDDDPMNPFTDFRDQPGHILRWTRDFDLGEEIREPDGVINCPHCEGSGYDPTRSHDPTDETFGAECKHCVGTGEQDSDDFAQWFSIHYSAALALPLRFEDWRSNGASIYVSDWDNANAVWIFTAEDLQTEWSGSADDATKYATAMLAELSDYYQGNVYGFVVNDPAGEHVSSCWGFIGEPWKDDAYIMKEARAAAEYGAEEAARERAEAFRAACSDVVTV